MKLKTAESQNTNMLDNQRIAIIHDWLITFGGAERVLAHILQLFPHADIFSLYDFLNDSDRERIQGKNSTTSFLQKLPRARTKYRSYLPFMPYAIEQFDLRGYDLVISSSHAVARGVLTGADQLHISYTNNTMVYAWDLYQHYVKESGLHSSLKGAFARAVLHYVRTWDAASAHRVDSYVANSAYMARRLKKQYGRTATVIYPPVDIENSNLSNSKDDYFVTVSRLVPFKRIDLIVDAFSRMPDRKLIVIGDGPELRILKKKAGANIEFTGFLPPANTKKTISRARALVFASIEPFGLVMVEAQACGTPVLAFNRGGASEIITDPACGTLYERQTADAIIETVHNFDRFEKQFDPDKMKTNAQRFSAENFHTAFGTFVEREYAAFRTGLTGRTE